MSERSWRLTWHGLKLDVDVSVGVLWGDKKRGDCVMSGGLTQMSSRRHISEEDAVRCTNSSVPSVSRPMSVSSFTTHKSLIPLMNHIFSLFFQLFLCACMHVFSLSELKKKIASLEICLHT